MLLTWCYGLTHNFSLPRATGCLHSSDREKTVSRNTRKRYVSERACFYIPKGEKPRNFMSLEAKSYSTINTGGSRRGVSRAGDPKACRRVCGACRLERVSRCAEPGRGGAGTPAVQLACGIREGVRDATARQGNGAAQC